MANITEFNYVSLREATVEITYIHPDTKKLIVLRGMVEEVDADGNN